MSNLNRFIEAQEKIYDIALSEIKSGNKRSHWMWYIFPQLKGIGKSEMSLLYGIEDFKEAVEYFNHPILRERLIEITTSFLDLEKQDPLSILGKPDDKKLKSCMTLFNEVFKRIGDGNNIYKAVLEKFYNGQLCRRTLQNLNNQLQIFFIKYLYKGSSILSGRKFIEIEAILITNRFGYIYKCIPTFEFHEDNLSDGDQDFYPKVGEHFYYDSKSRIEKHSMTYTEYNLNPIMYFTEMPKLDDYLNRFTLFY